MTHPTGGGKHLIVTVTPASIFVINCSILNITQDTQNQILNFHLTHVKIFIY